MNIILFFSLYITLILGLCIVAYRDQLKGNRKS